MKGSVNTSYTAVRYVTMNVTEKIVVNNYIGTEYLYGNNDNNIIWWRLSVHTQTRQFYFNVQLIFQEGISMVKCG